MCYLFPREAFTDTNVHKILQIEPLLYGKIHGLYSKVQKCLAKASESGILCLDLDYVSKSNISLGKRSIRIKNLGNYIKFL